MISDCEAWAVSLSASNGDWRVCELRSERDNTTKTSFKLQLLTIHNCGSSYSLLWARDEKAQLCSLIAKMSPNANSNNILMSAEVVIPNNSMLLLLSTSELWCSWSFINSLMEVMVATGQGAVGTQQQKGKLNFSELCKQQWTIWRSFVRQTNYCKQHWQLGQSRYPPKIFLVLTFLCYLPLFFSFFLLFSLFIAVTDVGWKEGEIQSVKMDIFV